MKRKDAKTVADEVCVHCGEEISEFRAFRAGFPSSAWAELPAHDFPLYATLDLARVLLDNAAKDGTVRYLHADCGVDWREGLVVSADDKSRAKGFTWVGGEALCPGWTGPWSEEGPWPLPDGGLRTYE